MYLDEPDPRSYYGGETAAPIFRRIAERAAAYLGLRPDVPPPPEPSPKPVEPIAETGAANTLTTAQTGRNF